MIFYLVSQVFHKKNNKKLQEGEWNRAGFNLCEAKHSVTYLNRMDHRRGINIQYYANNLNLHFFIYCSKHKLKGRLRKYIKSWWGAKKIMPILNNACLACPDKMPQVKYVLLFKLLIKQLVELFIKKYLPPLLFSTLLCLDCVDRQFEKILQNQGDHREDLKPDIKLHFQILQNSKFTKVFNQMLINI